MLTDVYRIIGVMSGTSLDGVDLAYISFHYNTGWNFKLLKAETIAYSSTWENQLQNAHELSNQELDTLNSEYTLYLAHLISKFIEDNNIKTIDAICSHGHTILHQPNAGFTLQIGNLPKISKLLQQRVICDFRVEDVKLGGQGAPLVPIGDRLLFETYDFCINLGGFANVSTEFETKRIAYDICAVNTVLNRYAQRIGLPFDKNGDIAAQHEVETPLLNELNKLIYYKKQPPKSLGIEWVQLQVLPILESYKISTESKIATYTEHCAQQIAKSLKSYLNTYKKPSVLITGGGAFNTHLINRLKAHLPNATIKIPDNDLVNYKEALVFGLLGVLRLRNEVNVLSSVTGASRDHCAGNVFEVQKKTKSQN